MIRPAVYSAAATAGLFLATLESPRSSSLTVSEVLGALSFLVIAGILDAIFFGVDDAAY